MTVVSMKGAEEFENFGKKRHEGVMERGSRDFAVT